MNGREKILFIVEGKKLEPIFIRRMTIAYAVDYELFSVQTNIHILYERLKSDDGYTDVIPVLKEILQERIHTLESNGKKNHKDLTKANLDLRTLDQKFSSIYLIFDSELHHRGKNEKDVGEILKRNCNNLEEMAAFFNNETEKGKLYINYPMMESYRDCDDFFDPDYKNRHVSLDILFGRTEFKGYKDLVGKRKLARVHLDKITKEQFDLLISTNVFKLNKMYTDCWNKTTYDRFREQSLQNAIVKSQYKIISSTSSVAVLNTCLFFLIDYYGEDFYNEHICNADY